MIYRFCFTNSIKNNVTKILEGFFDHPTASFYLMAPIDPVDALILFHKNVPDACIFQTRSWTI